jgi:hypothetical protein
MPRLPESPGPASIPDADAPSPSAPLAPDGEIELVFGDDEPSAAMAAITLPREVVLARRRARRRLRLDLRRLELPLDALARWGRIVLFALPPLLMVVVALGAAVTGIGSLAQVLRLVVTLQLAQVAVALDAIDASGRVLLACVGYFALLAALRPLARGLIGVGWARLGLLWGLLVALPSAWLFIAGAELAAGASPLSRIAQEWWRALIIALVLHLILLAVISARPPAPVSVTTQTRVTARPRRDADDTLDLEFGNLPSERLPLVRFGPPAPPESPEPLPLTDTQAMRVAGLLHTLPPQSASAHEEPQPDANQGAGHESGA